LASKATPAISIAAHLFERHGSQERNTHVSLVREWTDEIDSPKHGKISLEGLLKFKIARSQFPEYTWSLWQRRKTRWLRLK
jgi:hypothetical protein